MDTYSGVKKFIEKVVTDCKKNGYVTTLSGRRRYLPNINNSINTFAQSAAERQAINSTVQGSAADLVKKAMLNIQKKLHQKSPKCKK